MDDARVKFGQGHQKRDDAVFKFFKQVMEDVGTAFRTDKQNRPYIAERAQVTVAFTFVDVLSSYWYEYAGKTGTQSERFIEWVGRYCLTQNNPLYDHTDFAKLSVERMYSFRNSMVHFFGISNPLEENIAIGIVSPRVLDDEIQRWRKAFEMAGHTAIIFTPKQLYDLVLEGSLLMLDEWKTVIELSQTDEAKKWGHIEGIDRIYKKIQLEGAALVEVPQTSLQANSSTNVPT